MAKTSKTKSVKSDEDIVGNYNKVVDSANIYSVRLLHISFDVDPVYYESVEDHDIAYKVEAEDSYYNADDGFAACLVFFQVVAKGHDEQTLLCEARYTVGYSISQPCDEDAVKTYLNRVGVFACYPYFRGLFANLDWSANTQLPPLPVHRENIATRPEKQAKSNPTAKAEAPAEND